MIAITSVDLENENRALREELDRVRSEVGRANQRQRDFIALAAHELRSPLAVLFGYAKILESETEGTARERAEVVTTHAWRLKSIVDEIVILQQIDAGELVLRFESIEVAPLIRFAVDSRQREIDDKELTLETFAGNGVAVRADRERLGLILDTLISNAIKFTPHGGRIAIDAQTDAKHATISVRDNGVGIAPEDQKHLFERFFQAGDIFTRHNKGLGLGLSIAKALVERLDGRIWVDSAIGQGSTFHFMLPRALPGAQRPRVASHPSILL